MGWPEGGGVGVGGRAGCGQRASRDERNPPALHAADRTVPRCRLEQTCSLSIRSFCINLLADSITSNHIYQVMYRSYREVDLGLNIKNL